MPIKIYQVAETPAITWDSAGTTKLLTPGNLESNTGHQGAQLDLGSGAHARRLIFRFRCKFFTTPVPGQVIEVYLKTSDGTYGDNDDDGDTALSSEDKLHNLKPMGSIKVDQASTTAFIVGSWTIEVDHRYISPVIFNRTDDAATDITIELTSIADEIQ